MIAIARHGYIVCLYNAVGRELRRFSIERYRFEDLDPRYIGLAFWRTWAKLTLGTQALEFSPSDELLLSANDDHTARICNTVSS